jgi:hypothetical protein
VLVAAPLTFPMVLAPTLVVPTLVMLDLLVAWRPLRRTPGRRSDGAAMGPGGGSTPAEEKAAMERFPVDRAQFPYQSRYLALGNGARIHYVDEGSGPVLVLLHGDPTWSFLYRRIIAALKDDSRLVAPDYPGFGLSHAPPGYRFTAALHAAAMADFVERLDLRDVHRTRSGPIQRGGGG